MTSPILFSTKNKKLTVEIFMRNGLYEVQHISCSVITMNGRKVCLVIPSMRSSPPQCFITSLLSPLLSSVQAAPAPGTVRELEEPVSSVPLDPPPAPQSSAHDSSDTPVEGGEEGRGGGGLIHFSCSLETQ